MEELEKIISAIETQNDDRIPRSVVYILGESGFTSKAALQKITPENIKSIEQYVNDNFDSLIDGLSDYKRVRPFKLKPGHCMIIESIPELLNRAKAVEESKTKSRNEFQFVMKWLIETAERNAGREPKGRRFDETVKLFAIYLYIMSGRACYDTLSANLPLPQATSIGK